MSLKDWQNSGWLKPYQTSRQEIQSLLCIVERDIRDSRVEHISEDWRFAIAYNAALQCCTIALLCCGYQPVRGAGQHYRIIESLTLTMGDEYKQVQSYLNVCRTKRNISDYDRAGTISTSEVSELIEMADELYRDIKMWLEENYKEYAWPGQASIKKRLN